MVTVNGKELHSWDVTVHYEDGTRIPVGLICTEGEVQGHIDEFMDMHDVTGVTYENFRFNGTRYIHVTDPEFYRTAESYRND